MSLPGISVVIPTYNGSSRLGPVLEALQRQTGIESVPVEVILVDNASTDGTSDFSRQAWNSKGIELRILREERPGSQIAFETGVRSSRHELLVWVSDDNVLSPDYLSIAVELMQRYPQAAVCGGNGRPFGPGGPISKPDWIPKGWGSHGCGIQGNKEGPVSTQRQFVYGAGAVLRRAALDELDSVGFKPLHTGRAGGGLSGGEDVELCFALRLLGWQIIQSQRLTFDHLIPPQRFSWEYCVRLFESFGQDNAVLSLYFMFIGPGLKYRLKRTWPGVVGSVIYFRWKTRRCRRQPEHKHDPESIKRANVLGQGDELERLYTTGLLKRYFLQIRALHRRCTPFRLKREAHIRSARCDKKL